MRRIIIEPGISNPVDLFADPETGSLYILAGDDDLECLSKNGDPNPNTLIFIDECRIEGVEK